MRQARRNGALVCIPDGHLIIIGGFDGTADRAIDSVECLSLRRSTSSQQPGWRNIAPLPEPICAIGAIYFHGVVLIAGGQDANGRIRSSVLALKPPCLPLMKEEELSGSTENLGQWIQSSAELPGPAWVNCICRIGEELYTFGLCRLPFEYPKLFLRLQNLRCLKV